MEIYERINHLTSGATTQKQKAAIIGVDESTLSLILSRKRPISKRLALKLGYAVRYVPVYEPIAALEKAPYFHGYKVTVDSSMPNGRVRFVDSDNRTVGVIVGLAEQEAERNASDVDLDDGIICEVCARDNGLHFPGCSHFVMGFDTL